MNKRERAISAIIADVARNGVAGQDALRAYVENRISRTTFNQAVAKGMKWYNANRHRPADEDQQRPAPSQPGKSELPS
jgi:hypothetical protein